MKKILEMKNKRMFFALVFIVIAIITLFVLFIHKYNSFDKNEYQIVEGSILFDKDNNFIKVPENATLKQRIDGNYYLYNTKDNKTMKYEIGKNAVVYNSNDSYIYVYGKSYEINNKGEVTILEKENKVSMASPTKLLKLDDRKYLIVDSKIKSANDTLINTNGYLLVELDKQGKANFANNEINFKAIKPIVLEGNTFKFDIANEKLVAEGEAIDLKNVIGSTNEYVYKKPKNKKEDDKKKKEDATNQEFDYYEEYLNNVIKGVNNLTQSARNINENTKTKLSASNVYFDFDRWIALKKVSTTVNSINLDYVVFDPNNQYQVVEAILTGSDGKVVKNSLNKNNTSFNISNLKPNSEYKLQFGYQLNTLNEFICTDELNIKTKNPQYSIDINKISEKNIDNKDYQYLVHYTLNVDENYIFNTARIELYMEGYNDPVVTKEISVNMLDGNKQYQGILELPVNKNLSSINTVKLTNVAFCSDDSENNCNNIIELNVENTFSIE